MLPSKPLVPPTKMPYLGWRLASLGLTGLMMASIFYSGYFIYTSIYQTLDDANSIVVLNSNVELATINQSVYNKAHDLVVSKTTTSTSSFKITRNIFIPVITPSSTKR